MQTRYTNPFIKSPSLKQSLATFLKESRPLLNGSPVLNYIDDEAQLLLSHNSSVNSDWMP